MDDADCFADWVEFVYDIRLVWAFERPEGQGGFHRHYRKLGSSFFRVLPAGPGQSHRLSILLAGTVKDHPGNNNYDRLRGVLRRIYEDALEAGFPVGGIVPARRRVFYVQGLHIAKLKDKYETC
jgi:hypothetical protein